MQKTMYLLCIVVHCASVLSLQSSVHSSYGWGHAFTYRWIKVYKPLFSTYVRTHAYMPFCSDTWVFGVVSCMNLHTTVYQNTITWQTVNCMIRKTRENGKLGSYMWGLQFFFVTLVIKWLIIAPIRLHGCAFWSGPSCNFYEANLDIIYFVLSE